jgi:hypothetical protein
MLDSETTQRIATEAVEAGMRVAAGDAAAGRGYADLTEADRHILSDLAARLAYRSPLVRVYALRGLARDTAEQAWRFCFVRGYLLALADAGHVASEPRSAEQLVALALDALAAVWAARGEATV